MLYRKINSHSPLLGTPVYLLISAVIQSAGHLAQAQFLKSCSYWSKATINHISEWWKNVISV